VGGCFARLVGRAIRTPFPWGVAPSFLHVQITQITI
jgi:hypothetical protein